MTTQSLRRAMVRPWRSRVLFPLSLSPLKTLRTVFFWVSASFMIFASSIVSLRIKVAGRRNKLHPCVVLNASNARSASTVASGMPITFPRFSSLRASALVRSLSDATSRALSLVRTMRFRTAFRSPTAGRFPESCAALLPFLTLSVRVPLFGAAVMFFFFIFGLP